jgi:YfiR/HmsC-like
MLQHTKPTQAGAVPGPALPRKVTGGCRWVLLLAIFGLGILRSAAQNGSQHEYELKAGVLYRIIEYVEWPKEAMVNNPGALQIGLIGQIPFADALEVLNGKTIQGRELIVKRLPDLQAAATCQVIFISASEKARIAEIVAQMKDRPVLTVSEVDGFAEQGGMVNLLAGKNHIAMEINREVTGRAKLSVSSQLLKLATVFPKQ